MLHAHDEWSSWIDNRKKAQSAVPVGLDTYEQAHERAQAALYRELDQYAQRGAVISRPPTQAEVSGVKQYLGRLLSDQNMSIDRYSHHKEWQAALEKISKAEQHLAETAEALEEWRADKQAAVQALEKVEKAMPTPSVKALNEIDGEIDKLQTRAAKISDTITAMKDESSIASALDAEAKGAAAELERLEAEALLGENNDSDKAAAITRVAKARKAAETACEKASKQATARRGLEALLTEAEGKAKEFQKIRRHVAIEVAAVEAAEAERALLDVINADVLRPLLARINDARDTLNANADPGTSYLTARIKIQLPVMFEIQPETEMMEL